MKQLSIIIPHKNSLSTLPRLIQSIPKCDSIEVIVVDDHSDKNIQIELEKFCAGYPMIQLLENHTDIFSSGKARNIGLEHAKGEWILFADADDYFLDNFDDAIQKWINTDRDMIYFRPQIEATKENFGCLPMVKVFDDYEYRPTEDNLMRLTLTMVTPWSKLIRHTFLKEQGIWFDEVLKNNDVTFSRKAALATTKIEITQERIYAYNVLPSGLTKRTDLKSYFSVVDVHSRNLIFLREKLPKKKLLSVNPECFYTHYRLLYSGLREYRSVRVVGAALKIYKKNGLFKPKYLTPIFAVIAYYQKKSSFGQ